jgi:hypothetical protein
MSKQVILSVEHNSLMEDGQPVKPQISNPAHIQALKKFLQESSVKEIVSLVSKLAAAYKSKG